METQTGILASWQEHAYLTSLLALLLTLYLLARYFTPTVSPDEPPLISHPIPFIGHLLGILIHGVNYFDEVGQRLHLPIFTLPILNSKVYVITSPNLVTACMRETRTLSFNPFIVEVFRRLAHLTHADMDITRANMDSKTQPGYMTDMHRAEYAALAPGPALDNMSHIALTNLARLLTQTLPVECTTPVEIDLYAHLRSNATLAALRAAYGPENPFDKEPGLITDFWVFEQDLKFLLLDVCPSLVARRAHQARTRLIHAFTAYYRTNGHAQASALVRDRYTAAARWGQELKNIAAFDVGLCFGILANAMPTVFWILVYVYSDSDLLGRIRQETSHLVRADRAKGEIRIDLRGDRHMRTTCPVLTSTFHETLRVISSSLSSGRFVLQDTILTGITAPSLASTGASPNHIPVTESVLDLSDNDPKPQTTTATTADQQQRYNHDPLPRRSYLLKAGATVQIPSHSLHHPPPPSPTTFPTCQSNAASTPTNTTNSPFATGTHSPSTFHATRFHDLGPKLAPEPERSINGSFRAFGGGSTLCPGRKFAFLETVGAVVLFVQLYDLFDVTGGDGGKRKPVRVPEREVGKVAVAVAKPKGLTTVQVERRKEFAGLNVIGACSGGRGEEKDEEERVEE